jgi:hypothetical protein
MNSVQWIIYESSTRWAAALRTYFRRTLPPQPNPRIFESRRLRDVAERLRTNSASIVLLEIGHDNLAAILAWLAETSPKFPAVRFTALLDRSLVANPLELDDIIRALFEAGACEIARSPRHLTSIIALAQLRTHAETATGLTVSRGEVPLREWAWSRLPWQADQRRLG